MTGSGGPRCVLAVYAHPDDPEVSAGGTLARWSDEGAAVHVVITTRGDKGTDDPDADTGALAARRVTEAAAAAAVLGVASTIHLDHSDGDLVDDRALRLEIVRLVRTLRPDVVCCPDPTSVFLGDGYVNHRDHRITGWATLDAVAPAASNPHYFAELRHEGLEPHQVGEIWLSGTREPNRWVDIGATIDRKIEAVFRHRSQVADAGDFLGDFLRDAAADAGRPAGIRCAEAFRRVVLA
ncbi:MAG: PIG-L deacetylase family protein [Actinomycetota bacterium]